MNPPSGHGGVLVRYLMATSETSNSAPAAAPRSSPSARSMPSLEAKPEEALGDDGEEDEPAGEHCLHDRQRCERERADVKAPGEDRHDPPDRKPSGAEEVGGSAQWMTDADRRSEDRATLLEQKRDVGAQRRSDREQESQDHGPGLGWVGGEASRTMAAGRLRGRSSP
jgi:hypothetical protein